MAREAIPETVLNESMEFDENEKLILNIDNLHEFGNVYHVVFLILNVIIAFNTMIAILSSTYSILFPL